MGWSDTETCRNPLDIFLRVIYDKCGDCVMSCYHPLKAWQIGLNASGKPKYKITSYDVDYVFQPYNSESWACGKVSDWSEDDTSSFKARFLRESFGAQSVRKYVREYIEIPCGKCVGCRLEYSRQWANRCMLELQYHDSAYFVTLTYDDAHLPHGNYVDEDGNPCQSDTLVPRHLQLFLKLLRRHRPSDNIRFYACGEYGSKTARPHYHLIIFGLHLDDLTFYKSSFDGHSYYTSQLISDCWRDCAGDGLPRGFAVVADVTWETCAYVARYCMKKLNGTLVSIYDKYDLEPEFCRMSRRPGLAAKYYEDHKDEVYDYDKIVISTSKGGKSFKPPRYYDQKYDIEYPEEMSAIKQHRREIAEALTEVRATRSNLPYQELLAVQEEYKKKSAKKLVRDLV